MFAKLDHLGRVVAFAAIAVAFVCISVSFRRESPSPPEVATPLAQPEFRPADPSRRTQTTIGGLLISTVRPDETR